MSRLVESDVPKIIPGEAGRFFARPGWPLLAISDPRVVETGDGRLLQFDVLNRGPLPLLVSLSGRLATADDELWTDKAVEFIGPFSRDEWQLGLPVGVHRVDLRLGLFPVEIAIARKEVSF